MSNLEKYKNFFETELSCLSATQIDKYVQKNVTKTEQYQFEKHLLDCEFCNEAVEGITSFEKPINLTAISEQINSEIATKYRPAKNKTIPLFSYLKVAASVLVLLTAGWFVFDKNFPENQNMAFSEDKQVFEESATIEKEDTEKDLAQGAIPIIEKQEKEKGENQEENQKLNKKSEIKEAKAIKTKVVKQNRNMTVPPSIPQEIEEDKVADLDTEMTEKKDKQAEKLSDFVAEEMEEMGAISDDEGSGFATQNNPDPLIRAGKTQSIISSQDESELKNQKRKRDTGKPSLKKLKKEVKKKSKDLDLRYQYALAFFDNKEWNKSLNEFEKVLADTLQIHYQDALWYSALIQIEQKKLAKAKEKLEKLLQNKTYQDRAKQKLKGID